MNEILKQGLCHPLHVTDEVLSIFAGTQGALDEVPLTEVAVWIEGMLKFVREQHAAVWQKITDTKTLDDESAAAALAAMCRLPEGIRRQEAARRPP